MNVRMYNCSSQVVDSNFLQAWSYRHASILSEPTLIAVIAPSAITTRPPIRQDKKILILMLNGTYSIASRRRRGFNSREFKHRQSPRWRSNLPIILYVYLHYRNVFVTVSAYFLINEQFYQ